MMLMPERKKAVTVIIAGMGGGDGSSFMEDDASFAKKSCARKIIDCMKSEDIEGLCEAMENFMEMCSHNDSKPEMEY